MSRLRTAGAAARRYAKRLWSAPAWFLALDALVVLVGLWGMLQWTLIPLAVDGSVAQVGWQSESGLRYRVIELESGRSILVTRGLVARAGGDEDLLGRHVHKTAWTRELDIDGETVGLSALDETVRPAVALILLAVLAAHRRTRFVDGTPSR